MKCHQYWPEKGSSIYDNIKVILHKEHKSTNYCVRHFFIEQVIIAIIVLPVLAIIVLIS